MRRARRRREGLRRVGEAGWECRAWRAVRRSWRAVWGLEGVVVEWWRCGGCWVGLRRCWCGCGREREQKRHIDRVGWVDVSIVDVSVGVRGWSRLPARPRARCRPNAGGIFGRGLVWVGGGGVVFRDSSREQSELGWSFWVAAASRQAKTWSELFSRPAPAALTVQGFWLATAPVNPWQWPLQTPTPPEPP